MAMRGGKRARMLRVHGPVHWGLLPGLLTGAIVVVLGAFTVVRQASYGVASVGFLAGLLLVLGATLAFIGFLWQALVAYGVAPFAVVWRRKGEVRFGSLAAYLGLSRRSVPVVMGDLSVVCRLVERGRDGRPMIYHLQFTSSGASLVLRSRGGVDPSELEASIRSWLPGAPRV